MNQEPDPHQKIAESPPLSSQPLSDKPSSRKLTRQQRIERIRNRAILHLLELEVPNLSALELVRQLGRSENGIEKAIDRVLFLLNQKCLSDAFIDRLQDRNILESVAIAEATNQSLAARSRNPWEYLGVFSGIGSSSSISSTNVQVMPRTPQTDEPQDTEPV